MKRGQRSGSPHPLAGRRAEPRPPRRHQSPPSLSPSPTPRRSRPPRVALRQRLFPPSPPARRHEPAPPTGGGASAPRCNRAGPFVLALPPAGPPPPASAPSAVAALSSSISHARRRRRAVGPAPLRHPGALHSLRRRPPKPGNRLKKRGLLGYLPHTQCYPSTHLQHN